MKTFRTRQCMTFAVLMAVSMFADRCVTHADEPAAPGTNAQRTDDPALELANAVSGRIFGSSSPTWLQRIGVARPQIKSLPQTRTSSLNLQTGLELPTSAQTAADQQDQRVDGTWREENGFIIIKLNGQELRLAKSSSMTTPRPALPEQSTDLPTILPVAFSSDSQAITVDRTPQPPVGGTVNGRLLHRGRPVSECQVSLIPLRRSFGGYQIDESAEPQSTITTVDGSYRFDHVSRGAYKLFWLPKGEQKWVRRIEYKPDVLVQIGKTARVKDIRTALRTLN